jgi:6,7-dimethyl-8-ribityllumazine synthase
MTSSDETRLSEERLEALRRGKVKVIEGGHDGAGLRIAIVACRFNGGISQQLLDGALKAATQFGVDTADVSVTWVPGAFEAPIVAQKLCDSGSVDAVVCLGAVIRGDTPHFEFVAGEAARGIQNVALTTGIPVIFGILTTNTVEQALERCRDDDTNKGGEALVTAIETARVLRRWA